MNADFRRSATAPAIAFAAVALVIGVTFLATLVIMKLELMQPGVQYLCAKDGPFFCHADTNQSNSLVKAPVALSVTFVLVPLLLAGVLLRLQKALVPRLRGWATAAMWLAFAVYLAVPLTKIYLSSSSSNPAPATQPMLFQPLSASSSSAQSDAIFYAIQVNKAAVAVLLILTLVSFIATGLGRPRSTISQIVRVGFASLMVWAIWVVISNLSALIKLNILDRNFGTKFFDPTSPPDGDGWASILELFESPEAWCVQRRSFAA